MSLVALIGFEHTSGTAAIDTATTRLAISQSVPRIQSDLDFFQNISGAVTGLNSFSDTRGVVRRYIYGPPGQPFNLYMRYTTGISPTRTGKWLLGCRVKINSSAPVSSLFACRLGNTTLSNQPTTTITSGGTYYCEIEINWATNSVTYYVNGEVTYSVVNDPTRIDSTFANWTVQIGGLTSPPSPQYWALTDIYFAVDVPGETNPVGTRLGQIKVQRLPIDTVTNAGKFATQSGTGTVIDALNATLSPTVQSSVTNGIITDPRGSLMELSYAAPTVTETIKAVHVYECGYRDQAAAVGMISNIQQGAVVNSKSVIPTTVTALQTVIDWPMTLDLNGEAWTPAKIAQLKVHAGSYRP